MSIAVLEFEKPLAELEDRIDAIMRMDAAGSGDASESGVTTGFVSVAVSAGSGSGPASSSAVPPISPIIMTASVSSS